MANIAKLAQPMSPNRQQGVGIGSLILAGTALIAGIIQGRNQRRISRENTEREIQANLELAKYSFQQNQEMWREMNAYNHPARQMERLASAGLNPNLIYGSGGSTGNTTGNIPKFDVAPAKYREEFGYDLPGTLGQFFDITQQRKQIDLTEKQMGLVEEQTRNTKLKYITELISQKGMLTDNQQKALDFQIDSELAPTTIEMGRRNLDLLNRKIDNMEQDLSNKQQMYNLLKARTLQTEAEAKMAELGIFKTDPLLLRTMVRLWMVENPKGTIDSFISDMTGMVKKWTLKPVKEVSDNVRNNFVPKSQKWATKQRTWWKSQFRNVQPRDFLSPEIELLFKDYYLNNW